jgi:hypothetical protein
MTPYGHGQRKVHGRGDDRNRTGIHGFAGTSFAFDLALWSGVQDGLVVPSGGQFCSVGDQVRDKVQARPDVARSSNATEQGGQAGVPEPARDGTISRGRPGSVASQGRPSQGD